MVLSLLTGVLFGPSTATPTEAGILDLLGKSASAQTDQTNNSKLSPQPTAMQANVGNTLISPDKVSAKDSKSNSVDNPGGDEPDIDQNSSVNIASSNALIAEANPTDVSHATDDENFSGDQVSVYIVRTGDSIGAIASMFGVSVNTILAANDMKKGEKLIVGSTLTILPISGMEHTILKGETVESIAKKFNVKVEDITSYNGIVADAPLTVGDQLMIPDGTTTESDTPIKDLGKSIAKDTKYYQAHPSIKKLSGYYINPTPGYKKSQGIHDNNGVDLAISTGTPILASASGKVLVAKSGCVLGQSSCGGGYGNYVVINHSNGTQTLYAHQSRVIVSAGSQVTQGQIIGYVGSTGHSTGSHLHFEIHGARNPGADGNWAH